VIWIIVGTLVIVAVFVAGACVMASETGWKLALQIWAGSLLVTAVLMGASCLIAYGGSRL
jgi:hypothetical protein